MKTLDLNGVWKLRWFDGARNGQPKFAERETIDESRYLEAIVPGEVHLDLVRAGILADLNFGVNLLAARWVEECMWAYRREFEASDEMTSARVWLFFECVDYTAKIVLNGIEVGQHHNSFLPCRIDLTGKLRSGRNVLTVHLESGLFEVADKPITPYESPKSDFLTKRQWLRKSTQQAGNMDWSNRLLNIGIQGPVRLEWTTTPIRLDQLVPLTEVSPDLASGTVLVRQFIEGLIPSDGSSTSGVTVRLTASLVEANLTTKVDFEIKPGLHAHELTLTLPLPRLWWPREHGEPSRYTVTVIAEIAGQRVGESTAKVGFRRIRFNQDVHPDKGRYFILEVNNRPIFAKGANLIPADMIQANLTPEHYSQLLDLAVEANFNFLRVWGGGYYESDAFYDRCDELGILVWQEFSHAAMVVPAHDPEWHDNVMAESTHQVRRLARHPSLIAWCGNNEMEMHIYNNYYGEKHRPRLLDHGLFHSALPRMLKAEDPHRYYQPSSPYSPDWLHANIDEAGDQHPWNVGMKNTDFRAYREMTCRFADEGGTLGPRSLPTMQEALPEGQRYAHSFAWEVHDNSIAGFDEPSPADLMLEQWLGLSIRDLSLEEYAYWGGLIQGEGFAEFILNFRRRMFDSAAAVFWMFNDCWPTIRSWSIVDYRLQRVPAFWPVRRAFTPIQVVVAIEGAEVIIFGINETVTPVECELEFGLFSFEGKYSLRFHRTVELPTNTSVRLGGFPLSDWQDPNASAAFAVLRQGGRVLARHRLLRPFFREMKWPEPRIEIRLEKGQAIFSSDSFAWNLCLDLAGDRSLADNFFDLYPGQEHTLSWPWPEAPRILFVGNRHA